MASLGTLGAVAIMAIGSLTEYQFAQGLEGFDGVQDTTIFSELEHAGGGTDGIFIGTTKLLRDRRALIRVDLSSIPENAVVVSVRLTMVVDRSGENFGDIDLHVHRLTRGWGEGSVVGVDAGGAGGAAMPGDATWQMARFGEEAWSTPGGDFLPAPRATATAGRSESTVVWTSEAMAQDVQDWLALPEDNHGWIIVSALEGQQQRVKRLFSSEAAQNGPMLRIVVDLPGPELPWGSVYGLVLLIMVLAATGAAWCARERTMSMSRVAKRANGGRNIAWD